MAAAEINRFIRPFWQIPLQFSFVRVPSLQGVTKVVQSIWKISIVLKLGYRILKKLFLYLYQIDSWNLLVKSAIKVYITFVN